MTMSPTSLKALAHMFKDEGLEVGGPISNYPKENEGMFPEKGQFL